MDGFEVRAVEVWYDRAHQQLFRERAAAHGRTGDAVPFTIVDDRETWIGFSDQIGRQIESAIVARRRPPADQDRATTTRSMASR